MVSVRKRPASKKARPARAPEAIVVVGGGGHAKVVISVLRKLRRYRILGYTDLIDHHEILGARYLGTDQEFAVSTIAKKRLNVVIAVGQVGLGDARDALAKRWNLPERRFPAIVSPNATVNEDVRLGDASVVMDGAVINSGASIGRGAIVNTNGTIEHDVTVGDWVHVAPGATISGGATIGRHSMIGAGATVIEGIRIAEGCMIGAGATVVKDIAEPGVYAGCPARRIK